MNSYLRGRSGHNIGPKGWVFNYPVCKLCKTRDGSRSWASYCSPCFIAMISISGVYGQKRRRTKGKQVRKMRKNYRLNIDQSQGGYQPEEAV